MSVPDPGRRRPSGRPSRSLSLVPTLSAEQGSGGRADNRVVINVGGVRYETYKSTLKNIPDTRLSWITETTAHNSDYDPDSREYYFDRHPGVFNMVLNYYRTGRLHAPVDVCGPLFEEELAFWGIDEKQIEACCWMTYSTHRDAEQTLAELDGGDDDDDDDDMDNVAERFGILEDHRPTLTCWDAWQPRVWNLLEDPYSSKGAQVMAAISILFVLLSITIFTLETHTQFRLPLNASAPMEAGWTVAEITERTYPLPVLYSLDYVCVAYFTLELVVRFVFCPSKLGFFKTTLNWVDLISVLPFYIEHTLRAFSVPVSTLQFFRTLRLVRIFRIFKLTRHFSGLKILGHTIKASAKEMILLVMFLVIFILIFACLVYLVESVDEHPLNYFKNIPIGLWWACVTMTTLGYGDIYPRTALGYLVGALCAVAGVLVLALPVPVIVNNFALYYGHAQARMKLPKKRRRILVGAPDMLKTQTGMPGESLAESGRLASLPRSVGDPGDQGSDQGGQRRPSLTDSLHSADSGNKTGGSTDSSFSSAGISVVFTDETSVGSLSGNTPDGSTRQASHCGSVDGPGRPPTGLHHGGVELNVGSLSGGRGLRPRPTTRKDSVPGRQRQTSVHSSDDAPRTQRRRSLMPGPQLSSVNL